MIIKSSSFLYLFDFDGTIVGSNQWKGIFSNLFDCFRFLHFNPGQLDIRWSILTGRPKIDRFFITSICKYHNLNPELIFTQPSLFYHSKKDEDVYKFKENFIKTILDEKLLNDFKNPVFSMLKNDPFHRQIKKILYIDNDQNCTYYLNMNKQNYSFLAISVSDFLKKDFLQLLTT